MKKNSLIALSGLCVTQLASSPVSAAVVIDNLTGGSNNFATEVNGPTAEFFGIPLADRETAFSFKTGPVVADLATLEVSLNPGDNSSALVATISTGSSVPGGTNPISLGSFLPSNFNPQLVTFGPAPATTITLAPNTEYWIHFTVPAGGGIYAIQNTDSVVAATGWSLSPTFSKIETNPWSQLGGSPRARIRLTTVDSIPEPQSVLFGSLGLLVFLLAGRKR